MEKTAEDILAERLPTAKAVGLVGVGKLGTRLRELAEKKGVKTLLCDPPRNLDEARTFLHELSGQTHSVFTGVAHCRPSPLKGE